MSAPQKPFATGFGILLGIIILWAASLGVFLAGRMIWLSLGSGVEGA